MRKFKEVVTHAEASVRLCSDEVPAGDDIHRNPNSQLIAVRSAYCELTRAISSMVILSESAVTDRQRVSVVVPSLLAQSEVWHTHLAAVFLAAGPLS